MKTLEEVKVEVAKHYSITKGSLDYNTDVQIIFARESLPDAFTVTFVCTNCGNRWDLVLKKYDEIRYFRTAGVILLYIAHKGTRVPILDTPSSYLNCSVCDLNNSIIVHDRKPL